jgi:DNA-binding NtrC family response regulator
MQEAEARLAQGATLKDRVFAFERALIEEALAVTAGNQRQAAFRLGVLPTTLHEKMKRLGMIPPATRASRAGGTSAADYAPERFRARPSAA